MLAGLRALDLSQFIPGPYATRILADQGAEVIKVEPPRGDAMRELWHDGDGVSPVYAALNRGKRIWRADLKDAHCKNMFLELVRGADALLESFRPGVMRRLGLDWRALQKVNPKLIYCSLSGYGQNGVLRETAGHDINYCAAAGLFSSESPRAPAKPAFAFPPLADHASSLLAANAILSALYARAQDGRGRYLDISIYESALAFRYLGNLRAAGARIRHYDFLSGGAACYNIYRTADSRYVTLGAVEEKFWHAFCDALGESAWRARQYESFPQCALIREVQTRIGAQPLAHWEKLLGEVDCCYQAVPRDNEVLHHAQTRARKLQCGHDIAYPAWVDAEPSPQPRAREEICGAPVWKSAS